MDDFDRVALWILLRLRRSKREASRFILPQHADKRVELWDRSVICAYSSSFQLSSSPKCETRLWAIANSLLVSRSWSPRASTDASFVKTRATAPSRTEVTQFCGKWVDDYHKKRPCCCPKDAECALSRHGCRCRESSMAVGSTPLLIMLLAVVALMALTLYAHCYDYCRYYFLGSQLPKRRCRGGLQVLAVAAVVEVLLIEVFLVAALLVLVEVAVIVGAVAPLLVISRRIIRLLAIALAPYYSLKCSIEACFSRHQIQAMLVQIIMRPPIAHDCYSFFKADPSDQAQPKLQNAFAPGNIFILLIVQLPWASNGVRLSMLHLAQARNSFLHECCLDRIATR